MIRTGTRVVADDDKGSRGTVTSVAGTGRNRIATVAWDQTTTRGRRMSDVPVDELIREDASQD